MMVARASGLDRRRSHCGARARQRRQRVAVPRTSSPAQAARIAQRPLRPRGRRRRPQPPRRRRRRQPIGAPRGTSAGSPGTRQPRLPGRRPARRAAHLRRDQRPQHRHRSGGAGHGRRRAARRAVGSGARHHPARQQARLPRRRHHRPHRAARRCSPTKRRSAASWPTSRRSPASCAVLTKTLSYAKAEELQAAADARARCRSAARCRSIRARTRSSSPTCRDRLTTRDRADRHARPRAAAGRDRSAHRPDQQELRARARRPVGLQRPRRSGARQHDAPGVPEQRQPRRAASAARTGRRPAAADGGQPRRRPARRARVGLALGSVNGAFNLDVALSALETQRQRPHAVDAARLDAEQRRGRNDAGRADSDSDRREQHRHGHVQGRGADAEGDAADHRGRTPSSCRSSLENASPDFSRAGQRHSADQHAARASRTVLVSDGADDGDRRHLREQPSRRPNDRTPGLGAFRCSAGCSSATRVDDQSTRAADLHHAAHHQELRRR